MTEPAIFNRERIGELCRMPIKEPLELRLQRSSDKDPFVAVFWVNDNGIIGSSMTAAGSSMGQALSNLQYTGPLPKKAVQGWQFEVADAIATGLYPLIEIR